MWKKSELHGHPTLILQKTESTNTFLRENEAPMGALVIAYAQSAGRGRRGNSFFSPSGGAYFSMKLPRSMPDSEMWAVTFMAANAVCDAITELGGLPAVKWVNDVYLGKKKVCGILCEVREDHLILGIGVNLSHTAFPPEVADIATTLEDEGIKVEVNELVGSIVGHFDRAFQGWDIPRTLEKYRSRCFLIGKEITYTENGEKKHARVTGIADNGNLLCQRNGERTALHSGEVHTLRKKGESYI